MDFGFAGLVDKFEDYFGRKVTKALLVLIAATVVSACMALIWKTFLNPLISTATKMFPAISSVHKWMALFELAVQIGLGLGLGLTIFYAAEKYLIIARLRRLESRYEAAIEKQRRGFHKDKEYMERAGIDLGILEQRLDELKDILSSNQLIVEEVVNRLVHDGQLNEQQAAEILSITNIAPESPR